tara:strand:+ start:597 stop:1139 length:543 start_codon:yes stop_codon:yes gene_type:complete
MCKQNNKWKYQGDTRYEKVYEKMQLLGIQDITTDRQHKNGTVVWRLPIKNTLNKSFIEVASFSTGYLRNQNSCHSNYQLNKTKKEKRYVEMIDYDTGRPVIKTFKDTVRVLIPIEIDRLEYLISYCLKNYYIKRANEVVDGEYIPKWKYESYKNEYKNRVNEVNNPEVKVIVNGHRYNIT